MLFLRFQGEPGTDCTSITHTSGSNACDGEKKKKKAHETEMIKCGGMFGSAAVTDVVMSPSVRGEPRLFGSIWH